MTFTATSLPTLGNQVVTTLSGHSYVWTAMSTEDRNVYGIEAPLALVASHAIANPGFQSARRGRFVVLAESDTDRSAEIVFRDLTVLGTPLAKFTLAPTNGETRRLRLDFDRPMTEVDALQFLQRFADAWSATLADTQRDAWSGNLYVEISWAGVTLLTAQSGGISGSMEMTSTEGVAVAPERLQALRWSPLTDVFVEGMKSTQPKSKFLFWFVILEELEKRPEFISLFTPMFSSEEKTRLQDAVRGNTVGLQRLSGILNGANVTVEGRPVKLARILAEIGCSTVQALQGSIVIDQARCAALIEQRNKVAHKGSALNKDLLYNVLFPLSRAALKYILDQDAGIGGDTQKVGVEPTATAEPSDGGGAGQ